MNAKPKEASTGATIPKTKPLPGARIRAQVAGVAILIALLPATAAKAATSWLIDPTPYRAVVTTNVKELVLENGLARRVIRLAPNAATVELQNLTTGEHVLRAIAPEARVTLNGADYAVGGLKGQPAANYIKVEWLDKLTTDPQAYRFTGWIESPIEAQFDWKQRREWMAQDLPWPPKGKHVVLRFAPPAEALPAVEVHYNIYDGIPLFSKWLVVINQTDKTIRLNRFVAEELRFAEPETSTMVPPTHEYPNLYVETDYTFGDMSCYSANQAVQVGPDPDYPTQVHYECKTPCLLKCLPPKMGPDADLEPGKTFESFRVYDLLLDSSERERRTLAQRRMYRIVAPWTAQNPLMFHKIQSDPASIRTAIDQAAEVGFEMVIMSFGSGFNYESTDSNYLARYKELADYGKSKGVALGGYSLLASRGAATTADNTQGHPPLYGVMPCLGANWGQEYLQTLRTVSKTAGLGLLEHDGSYPGDRCAATNHPFHHGLEDSQWVQWRAITDLYKWCTANGVYLNIPDWYFLAGGTKCAMHYRESNWSLPRAEQELIERQNIFDGTWNKTASMGWMFVPLSEYQGGGEAATIEPLKDHLPHYEARLANLLGAGVQACYRGPRLFDCDETKAVVKKWVAFYKAHREVLDGDIIHLRRANGLDWDGILHVNPMGKEKALLMLYNPLAQPVTRMLTVPLYYTGLTGTAQIRDSEGSAKPCQLDRDYNVELPVTIPARSRAWYVIE